MTVYQNDFVMYLSAGGHWVLAADPPLDRGLAAGAELDRLWGKWAGTAGPGVARLGASVARNLTLELFLATLAARVAALHLELGDLGVGFFVAVHGLDLIA